MLLVASSSDNVMPMENQKFSHYCPGQSISPYVAPSQLDGRLEGMGNSYSIVLWCKSIKDSQLNSLLAAGISLIEHTNE